MASSGRKALRRAVGLTFSCHLCPTGRHSFEIRACRLATPEVVAKIGAEGHDDHNAAD
jgi:hypothetical protein